MAKEGLIAVGAGALSALAVLSILSGSALALPFFYLAPMPLYLAGLGYGVKAAGFAAAGGTMVAGMLGGMVLALPYAAAYGVPAWTITRMAVTPVPAGQGRVDPGDAAGRILAVLSLMACMAVVVGSAYASSGGMPLEQRVGEFLGTAFSRIGVAVPADAQSDVVAAMASVFPGMAAGSWVLMTVVSLVLAQAVLSKTGRARLATPRYAAMRLPEWASWPLVGAAVLVLLADGDLEYAARNVTFVAAAPVFFLGLAVIHTIVRQVQGTGLILTGVYLVVALSGWAQMVVAGIGITELWLGVRRRFAGSPKERENE